VELLLLKELFLLLRHIINQDNISYLNSYPLQETGDKDIKLFTSEQGIDYILEMLDYSSRLPDPITGSIYTFNFDRTTPKEKGELPDERIRDTVLYFVSLYLEENINAVITICDSVDRRERGRYHVFRKWFDSISIQQLEKIDREVECEDLKIPCSLFIHTSNPERDYILSFFHNMSFNY
jgi:hypothetical protein